MFRAMLVAVFISFFSESVAVGLGKGSSFLQPRSLASTRSIANVGQPIQRKSQALAFSASRTGAGSSGNGGILQDRLDQLPQNNSEAQFVVTSPVDTGNGGKDQPFRSRMQTQLFPRLHRHPQIEINMTVGKPTFAELDTITVVNYHKTGVSFSDQLLKLRQQHTNEFWDELTQPYLHVLPGMHGKPKSWDWRVVPTSHMAYGLHRAISPPADFKLPVRGPVIHWIRDPLSLIISGYRYHVQQMGVGFHHSPESAWMWNQEGVCTSCQGDDWQQIFSICGWSCSYGQMVQKIPEEQGIIVETLNERDQIDIMIGNTLTWAANPRVLHLSVEYLKVDYDGTMECLNNFLGAKRIHDRHVFDVLKKPADPMHVTTGKYNNTLVRSFLESIPVWRAEFDSVKSAMNSLFERQARVYGCPELKV